jgi:hypothetical protein
MVIGTDLDYAAQIVRSGGVIAYPTETVYGVGALATDAAAIRRVFEVKHRPLAQPLSIAVSGMGMLKSVAKVECEDFILRFLPGPVTVILKKRDVLPDILTAGSRYVRIRYPAHDLALQVRIRIILVAVVVILGVRFFGCQLLQPGLEILVQACLVIIHEYAGRYIHCVDEDQALQDAAFVYAFLDLRRYVDVSPPGRDIEKQFLAVRLHICTSFKILPVILPQ